MTVTDAAGREVSLRDRYALERGRVQLSGVQALVRLIFDQRRADTRAGGRTAAFVSGYEGSPLSTLDLELGRQQALLDELGVIHVPAVNEELAATAAWGSQLARSFGSSYDGVLAIWYGKAPGLDRACDALRHANWVGTGPRGGGLVLVGDDPVSKSSTLPSASELALADLGIPVFFPGSVQEILDLGAHAIACSRASGIWCALKLVTNVADATATVEVAPERMRSVAPALPGGPRPEHVPHGFLLAPQTLELERGLVETRLELARRYAAANGLNVREGARDGWLGIVTAGKPYYDLRQALLELGIGDGDLERLGVRILKLGVIWPLDPDDLRGFAEGLEEILVVEEKRPFVEPQLRDALYGMAGAPRVVGKRDEHGAALLPGFGELDAYLIAPALVARLAARVDVAPYRSAHERLQRLAAREVVPLAVRTSFFCSGCPHNRSTDVFDPGTLVGAGTGCAAMVLLNDTDKGRVEVITQMGGEGTQWIGIAPFVDASHFVQNMGDGTFHHSGQLSLRFAVAAGLHATFKVFYNQAVAMTGGQAVAGVMSVPDLTRALAADGVTRTIVTTDDVGRYRGVRLAANAEVCDRRELGAVQRRLAELPGVTVMLHDQQCAAEKRRLRKRGRLEATGERVVINERVCEGCGDCGRKSDCLSVRPVDTELGRKTQIHQPSCNEDFSCLDGDCPSFVTVRGARRRLEPRLPTVALPAPRPAPGMGRPLRLRLAGIGGTGVVTVSQILGMAALLDGAHAEALDQTGLSQKGGVVLSDVLLADEAPRLPGRAPGGGVDVYLAFDLLAATQLRALGGADPERTIAVISTSRVPTGAMIVDPATAFPELADLVALVRRFTAGEPAAAFDAARLAEALFADDLPANLIVLGAAWQAGLVPLGLDAVEGAIRLNGAAVEQNLAAFAWGRAAVVDPAGVAAVIDPPEAPVAVPAWAAEAIAATGASGELRRLLEFRVPDLDGYQGRAYALDYLRFVEEARQAEAEAGVPLAGRAPVAEAVARQLHRLMAYKDEYEVARLHLLAAERARLTAGFEQGASVYWRLQPPLLRALGLRRKLRLGPWFEPALRALRSLRRLRGTPFDPFGRAAVRRVERQLPGEYRSLVRAALGRLSPETHGSVAALCETPDEVRGYEEIKLAGVARFRERAAALLAELERDPA